MIKQIVAVGLIGLLLTNLSVGQIADTSKPEGYKFTIVKEVTGTAVNNQQRAGTCWSYSTMGMLEAEMLRKGKEYVNLS